MSKQIKGVWKFYETIREFGWAASADATKEYVNFTSYKSADEPAYNYIGFNLQHYTYSNGSGTLDNLQYLTSTTTADRAYVWEKRSTDTYELGWQNEAQRIVDFGETEQTVSDEFYYWLRTTADRVTEKTKVVSGVWQFNETIEDATFSSFYISFWSNGSRWKRFARTFLSSSLTPIGFQYISTNTVQDAYLYDDFNDLTKGWQSDAFRTVDFGAAEQLVYEHEYEWLVANAKYLGESDAHPVYIDVNGERKKVTAYMDIDGERKKVSTAR